MQKINFFIGELNPTDNFDFGKPYELFDGEWEVKLK